MTLVSLLAFGSVVTGLTSALFAQSYAPSVETLTQPSAFNMVGISTLKEIDPDLTGAGVGVAVVCRSLTYIDGIPQNDYLPDISHNCLTTADLGFYHKSNLPTGVSPHATSLCSILFGLDPFASHPDLGQFEYRGAVPNATGLIHELWCFCTNNIHPQVAPAADLITASFGVQFEEWWTRGLDAMAQHDGLLIVAGIGNGRSAYDPPLYPGASANSIGVGVVNSVATEDLKARLANFALAHPENSSCGPTASRRCKPDIVAPGNCLAAIAGQADQYEPTGDWSSFATPMVAGTAGLLIHKAKQQPSLQPAISSRAGNCVIKAILLNSATKLPFWHKGRLSTDDDHTAPLDYIQGAGMLNALSAYIHLISGRSNPGRAPSIGWDNNILQADRNPDNTYRITVDEPSDKVITVTLVWNKHYDRSHPFRAQPEKDADLRLELWAIDAEGSRGTDPNDHSDSKVDNVEHIHKRADPNCREYEIVVSLNDQEEQSDPEAVHRYGLAWNVSVSDSRSSIHWYDLNADGIVDQADIGLLMGYLLESQKSDDTYMIGDVNADGIIDIDDLQDLLDQANLQADWLTEQEVE
jgi:hypothetical protein